MNVPTVTSLLQGFFTERLVRQLQASPQTVSAYRDTMKLLLVFAAQETKKAPSRLTIDDLDAVTVGAFLSHLDDQRHNSTATRNARLAAVHSFYRYALPLIPDRAHTASQALAIPQRRHDRAIESYPDRARRPTPCWRRRTARPGTGAGTTLCSSPPFR